MSVVHAPILPLSGGPSIKQGDFCAQQWTACLIAFASSSAKEVDVAVTFVSVLLSIADLICILLVEGFLSHWN